MASDSHNVQEAAWAFEQQVAWLLGDIGLLMADVGADVARVAWGSRAALASFWALLEEVWASRSEVEWLHSISLYWMLAAVPVFFVLLALPPLYVLCCAAEWRAW